MKEEIYLSLLIFCAILSQGIGSLLEENISKNNKILLFNVSK